MTAFPGPEVELTTILVVSDVDRARLGARGAAFLTPPVASAWELRAFFRDPDGHLLEITGARTPG